MKNSILRTTFCCLLAGLAGTVVADSATRTSAFEYDTDKGVLTREVIEPDIPALCLSTTYTYDPHGNKATAEIANCAGATGDAVFASRSSSSSFDATSANPVAGQFPTTSTNALGHQEVKEYDAKFGSVTKLTGPNGLVTTWSYDAFGRKASETRADGTNTTWTYSACGTCPVNGAYFVTTASTGAPTAAVYYDKLNREIRTEKQGFDGSLVRKDTEYDPLGRVLRVSQPYIAGQQINWTNFAYDILGRVVTTTDPGGAVTNVIYNGLSVTTINTFGLRETRLKNSQGQLIRVTRE